MRAGPATSLDLTLAALRQDDGLDACVSLAWMPASALAASPRRFVRLLGLNSSRWPRAISEDRLLSDHIISTAELDPLPVGAADRRDFATILATTKGQVVLSRARRDTETLLLHVLKKVATETNLNINLAWLIAHDGEPLEADAAATFCDLIERRLAGEPIQYITDEAEFYGLPFHVNRDVLIPRPETEHLVEKAIELARELRLAGAIADARTPSVRVPSLRIVDVGTGSGAIAVALANALPFAEIRPNTCRKPK